MKAHTILTEKTLVPISLIITLVTIIITVALFVINLYFQTLGNSNNLNKHESKIEEIQTTIRTIQDDYKQQIVKLREDINNRLNEIIVSLTKITTTLEKNSPSKDLTLNTNF